MSDYKNRFLVINLDDIDKVFNINTIVRNKKSGSAKLPKKYYKEVSDFLNVNIVDGFFTDKPFTDKEIFELNDYRIIIRDKGDKFEVRKLGKTSNSTVIFSLKMNDDIDFDRFNIPLDEINE